MNDALTCNDDDVVVDPCGTEQQGSDGKAAPFLFELRRDRQSELTLTTTEPHSDITHFRNIPQAQVSGYQM